MAVDKLSVKSEMQALDQKDRGFYDSLTDEEKKKFSTFLMIRYGSCVSGIPELQQYYLAATNERLNKRFFSVNKTQHDKLNWLVATTISPGMGNQFHQWIPQKKRETAGGNKVRKFLEKRYPFAKSADIDLLEQLNDVKACKELAKELGYTPEQIKKELG